VPVEREVPVGQRREQVGGRGVDDDRVVLADAVGGHQLAERVGVDDTEEQVVLEFLPADPHGAGHVALPVVGVLVSGLDEHHARRVQVLLGPLAADQGGITPH
jgi:hypothetical protein